MGKVHVRRVTLQAFRAFQDKQSSPVLPTTGLVGIRGRDLTTGVSSGSGKSTIPLAIAYAFGFCPFPATEQQNLYVNTPMQVELELETDTGLAILRRGKEFSLTHNGKVTQGSAKAVEEEIRKMVGLPTDLLEALSYRQQQERGRFLSMTDQEKKSFLGTLLGAEELETQIADSIKKSNALQVEVDQLRAVVEALTEAHPAPVEPPYELAPTLVEVPMPAEPNMQSLQVLVAARKECEARILKKHEEIKGGQVSPALRKKLADKNTELFTLRTYRDQKDRLTHEIEALSNGVCPTCSGPWLDERKLQGYHARMDLVDTHLAKLPRVAQEVTQLESEIEAAEKTERQSQDAQAQLVQLMKVQDDLIKNCMDEERVINVVKQERDTVRRQNEMNQSQVRWVEESNRRIKIAYEKAVAQHSQATAIISEKRSQLDTKARQVKEEADYAAALKSYLGSLFDEVLAQISSETNELLRNVPNTPTTTVTFMSEGVTAKGVTRQEIRPVVLKNGRQVSLKSGISGGQLESVELAVDLSITKVIGQRTGVRPGFMIFDESFSAHCMPTKEACLQVLKQAAQDCLILVVDHATELKDYFDQFIDIESERDVSRFAISG